MASRSPGGYRAEGSAHPAVETFPNCLALDFSKSSEGIDHPVFEAPAGAPGARSETMIAAEITHKITTRETRVGIR